MSHQIPTARLAAMSGPGARMQALRTEIDHIDDALLDLMEQRLAQSHAIAELKNEGEAGILPLRPDREQAVIQRLSGRTSVPSDLVGAVWRELLAASLRAQRPTQLVLYAPQQPIAVTNGTRLRFGCASPIVVVGSPAEALDRARERQAIAVIELSPLSGWWVELAHERSLSIFDGLADGRDGISALAIGRISGCAMKPDMSFPIISEVSLRRRIAGGEAIRPIALSGNLRLCLSRNRTAADPSPGNAGAGR